MAARTDDDGDASAEQDEEQLTGGFDRCCVSASWMAQMAVQGRRIVRIVVGD